MNVIFYTCSRTSGKTSPRRRLFLHKKAASGRVCGFFFVILKTNYSECALLC